MNTYLSCVQVGNSWAVYGVDENNAHHYIATIPDSLWEELITVMPDYWAMIDNPPELCGVYKESIFWF